MTREEKKQLKAQQRQNDIVTLHQFADVAEQLLLHPAIDREQKRVLIDAQRALKRLLSA